MQDRGRSRVLGWVTLLLGAALIVAPLATAQIMRPSRPQESAIARGPMRPPQESAIARGPRPYASREVVFSNDLGRVRLAGTLSIPLGRGRFPAVLLVAGAGPMGRNEEVAGHRVFRVLADYLLRQNIAVLRYDKRGVGASTGNLEQASFDDLVADATAGFRYLKGLPEIDPLRVGVLGHSEGGSIAPAVAAADPSVAFVVAMAGSGLTGEFRITEHEAYEAQESGASDEQVAKIRSLCHEIFRSVAATSDAAAARSRITALIDRAVAARVMTSSQAKAMRELLTPQLVRTELDDDPIEYLKKVHVPVLALVGSLDRTVPAGPYAEAMRPVLAGIPGSRLEILPDLNHLMQTARTGSPREFGTIEESIAPLALRTIATWVSALTPMRPPQILALMERVAEWQLAHPSELPTTDWTQAVGYLGLMALAQISAVPRYEQAVRDVGSQNGWHLGPQTYFADDQAIGQVYLELYLRQRDAAMIAATQTQFAEIAAHPKEGGLEFVGANQVERWSWCDSLFMAPPAWTHLFVATGESAFLDYAVTHWWQTSDYLYDRAEHLYFRDSTYIARREGNGQKVFWSRGNGWVLAGLARVLQDLPPNHPARARFVRQFREMAEKIRTLQQPDGLWRVSLLDPREYPEPETSGSSLYVYALAWGVNHGLLDRATFGPTVLQGWQALVANVAADGKLTHVQPVGAAPTHFDDEHSDTFGVGAFLLAGSEVFKFR